MVNALTHIQIKSITKVNTQGIPLYTVFPQTAHLAALSTLSLKLVVEIFETITDARNRMTSIDYISFFGFHTWTESSKVSDQDQPVVTTFYTSRKVDEQ